MTNLEKYLAELLATECSCHVHKIRNGEDKCDFTCEDCKKKNLEWFKAEYEPKLEFCRDCKHARRIEGRDDIICCTHSKPCVLKIDNIAVCYEERD